MESLVMWCQSNPFLDRQQNEGINHWILEMGWCTCSCQHQLEDLKLYLISYILINSRAGSGAVAYSTLLNNLYLYDDRIQIYKVIQNVEVIWPCRYCNAHFVSKHYEKLNFTSNIMSRLIDPRTVSKNNGNYSFSAVTCKSSVSQEMRSSKMRHATTII